MGFFDSLQSGDVGGLLGTIGQGLADRRGLLYGIAANGFAGANEGRQSDQSAQLLKQKQQERELKRQALLAYAQANGIDPGLAQDEDTLKMQIAAKQHEELMKRQASQDAIANSHWGADYRLRQEAANKPTDLARQLDEAGITDPAERQRIYREHINKTAGGGAETFSMSPVYTEGPDGSVGVAQLGSRGNVKAPVLPNGAKILSPYAKAEQTASGAATGKTRAAAQAALPGTLTTGNAALELIDEVLNDPNREDFTGWQSYLPTMNATPKGDFANKVQQVTSGAYLQGVEKMRGTGPLSEAEGMAAKAAINRMKMATSDKEFEAATRTYRKVVEAIMGNARRAAGGAPSEDQGAFGGGSGAPQARSQAVPSGNYNWAPGKGLGRAQ